MRGCELALATLLILVVSSTAALASDSPDVIIVPDNYPSLSEAIEHAANDSTIVVRAGTYLEDISIPKPLELIGSGSARTVIGSVSISSQDVSLSGFTIGAGSSGSVILAHSDSCVVANCSMRYLRAEECRDLAIMANIVVARQSLGIYLFGCARATIWNNTVRSGGSIFLDASKNCSLRSNKLDHAWLIVYGLSLYNYLHDIDDSNSVNGKPVYYFVGRKNLTIAPSFYPDIGFLGLVDCDNVVVRNLKLSGTRIMLAWDRNCCILSCTIANASQAVRGQNLRFVTIAGNRILNTTSVAVYIEGSRFCSVENNTIDKGCVGLFLYDCTEFTIRGNTFSHNWAEEWRSPNDGALDLASCQNCRIYHNNFVENRVNAVAYRCGDNSWDNGPTEGGNYWQGFGTDADGDGICDSEYVIAPGNIDHYPLSEKDMWLGVQIESAVSDPRCDVDSLQSVFFHVTWCTDSSPVAGIVLEIGNETYVTNETGWIRILHREPDVGRKFWRVMKVCYPRGLTIPFTLLTDDPSIIWDQVNVRLEPVSERNSLGCPGIRWTACYEYDGSQFPGDVVLNDTVIHHVVGSFGYKVVAVEDPLYGITRFESNEAKVVFDRVDITLKCQRTRVSVGSRAPIDWTGTYAFDGQAFNGSIQLSQPLAMDDVGAVEYTVSDVTDPLYGLKSFHSNRVRVIFDRVKVVLRPKGQRVDVGTEDAVIVNAFYEYDGYAFMGHVHLDRDPAHCGVGNYSFTTSWIDDPQYGITTFTSNNVSVVFDKVLINLTAPKGHADIGRPFDIVWTAKYAYDNEPFQGTVTLNDTETKASAPCRRGYTVASIDDPKYGLQYFSSNSVSVVFDTVLVKLTVASERVDVSSTAALTYRAVYAYDYSPFDGHIVLNDTLMTQSVVGKRTYRVEAVEDRRWGLTSFQSNEVSIIFDRVEVLLSSPLSRVEAGTSAPIAVKAFYAYDSAPMQGSVYLSYPTKLDSLGSRLYKAERIIDDVYGLTKFTTNSLEVVFDTIVLEPSLKTTAPSITRAEVKMSFASDGQPVENATVFLNNLPAEHAGGGVYRAEFKDWGLRTRLTIVARTPGFSALTSHHESIHAGNTTLLAAAVTFIILSLFYVWRRRRHRPKRHI